MTHKAFILAILFSIDIILLNGCNDINTKSTLVSKPSRQQSTVYSDYSSFIIQYKKTVNLKIKIQLLYRDKATQLVTILNQKKRRIQLESEHNMSTLKKILSQDSDIQAFQPNYKRHSLKN